MSPVANNLPIFISFFVLLSINLSFSLSTTSKLQLPLISLEEEENDVSGEQDPVPSPWPLQFHALLFMNYSGSLSMIDLWYDWPNGRNFNIIQDQLAGYKFYDAEWNNGTSFQYTLDDASSPRCAVFQLEVGILRPNWLDGAVYLGREYVGGFLCDVWEKVEFIWYYEDVVTKRPVQWVFYTGRAAHVMTFEVGASLKDAAWQAPYYCFEKKDNETQSVGSFEKKKIFNEVLVRVSPSI